MVIFAKGGDLKRDQNDGIYKGQSGVCSGDPVESQTCPLEGITAGVRP